MYFSFSLLPHASYRQWKHIACVSFLLLIVGVIVSILFFKILVILRNDVKPLPVIKDLESQIFLAKNKIAKIDQKILADNSSKNKTIKNLESSKLIWLNFIENAAYAEKVDLKFIQQIAKPTLGKNLTSSGQLEKIKEHNQNLPSKATNNLRDTISYIQFGVSGNFVQLINFLNHITADEQTTNILHAKILTEQQTLKINGVIAFSSHDKPVFLREKAKMANQNNEFIQPFSKVNKKGEIYRSGYIQFKGKEIYLFN